MLKTPHDDVRFSFKSDAPWHDRLEGLVRLLDAHPTFRPERWGPSEPVRRPFHLDALPEMEQVWGRLHGMMFKRSKKPRFWIDTMWFDYLEHDASDDLWGGAEERFFKSAENTRVFLEFAKAIFQWGDMLHGYACHDLDFEAKHHLPRPVMIEGKRIGTGGMNLYQCLPGIYWANFFGKFYVDWFGEEKMRTAPCYAREELPGGGVLLLTAPSPLDYAKPEAKEMERRLLAHLGEDAFFSIENPTRPCRSPFKENPPRRRTVEEKLEADRRFYESEGFTFLRAEGEYGYYKDRKGRLLRIKAGYGELEYLEEE